MELSLGGKVALVTGDSRGIGCAIALRLARAAADRDANRRTGKTGKRQINHYGSGLLPRNTPLFRLPGRGEHHPASLL